MTSPISGIGGAGGYQAISGASMMMPPQQKMADLFSKIDTSGSGAINKSQFEQALQALKPPPYVKAQGADAIWSKLAPQGQSTITKDQFVTKMTSLMRELKSQSGLSSQSGAIPDPTQTLQQSASAIQTTDEPRVLGWL